MTKKKKITKIQFELALEKETKMIEPEQRKIPWKINALPIG